MNQKSLFQKICAVAFFIFAVISCIATAQSLTLTLEMTSIPFWLSLAIMFVFAFGLYLLTSYCFKLVIDSLNYDVFIENRLRDFVLGIFGVLLFWLLCSMPTNTHSLFYTKVIDRVMVAELDNQKSTLNDEIALLSTNINERYDEEIRALEAEIASLTSQFIDEIKHTDRIGLGERARLILKEIESTCRYNPDQYFGIWPNGSHTRQKNTSPSEITRIIDHYIPRINRLLEDRKAEINNIRNTELAHKDERKGLLNSYIDKIEGVKGYINQTEVAHQDRVNAAKSVLNNAYNDPNYRDKILDNVETLKNVNEGHKDSNVESYKIYKTERLHSVFKLWGDYMKDKLDNLDFDMFYWIIISIIIDIAGLVFFAIAFRKTN